MSYVTTIKGVRYTITKAPVASKKKLRATYYNNKTGRENTILFGAKGYQHYYDKSGLLPKSWNHGDKDRRRGYISRHRHDNLDRPSAGLLSMKILW